MLKRAIYRVVNILVVLSLLIIGSALITPLPAKGGLDHIELPTLTATITSPPNGSNIQIGQCFQVTARISATCPLSPVMDTPGYDQIFSFTRPVQALPACLCSTYNNRATISVAGNAAIQDEATKSYTGF